MIRRRPGQLVADIGGGRSLRYAEYLERGEAHVIAVDVSGEELALNTDVAETRLADAGSGLPFADGELDVLTSSSVIEHVRDVAGFLDESARVLKPDGVMVHILPCRYASFALLNLALPHGAKSWLLGRLYPSTHGICGFRAYYDLCSYRALTRACRERGFRVDEVTLGYNGSSEVLRRAVPGLPRQRARRARDLAAQGAEPGHDDGDRGEPRSERRRARPRGGADRARLLTARDRRRSRRHAGPDGRRRRAGASGPSRTAASAHRDRDGASGAARLRPAARSAAPRQPGARPDDEYAWPDDGATPEAGDGPDRQPARRGGRARRRRDGGNARLDPLRRPPARHQALGPARAARPRAAPPVHDSRPPPGLPPRRLPSGPADHPRGRPAPLAQVRGQHVGGPAGPFGATPARRPRAHVRRPAEPQPHARLPLSDRNDRAPDPLRLQAGRSVARGRGRAAGAARGGPERRPVRRPAGPRGRARRAGARPGGHGDRHGRPAAG